jgi:hypothetical protein
LIPVPGDVATVAPVIDHVKAVTEQLSEIVAFGTTTEAVQTPGSTFCAIGAGQVIVGGVMSAMVTLMFVLVLQPVALIVSVRDIVPRGPEPQSTEI